MLWTPASLVPRCGLNHEHSVSMRPTGRSQARKMRRLRPRICRSGARKEYLANVPLFASRNANYRGGGRPGPPRRCGRTGPSRPHHAALTFSNAPIFVGSGRKLLPVQVLLELEILARTDLVGIAQLFKALALRQHCGD